MPRTMPSVGSMATQRTRFSPRCCCDLDDDVDGHRRLRALVDDADRVVDRREMVLLELDVDHGTDDLDTLPILSPLLTLR